MEYVLMAPNIGVYSVGNGQGCGDPLLLNTGVAS